MNIREQTITEENSERKGWRERHNKIIEKEGPGCDKYIKAITIEEYKKRSTHRSPTLLKKKGKGNRKGGKIKKLERVQANLHRLIKLTSDKSERLKHEEHLKVLKTEKDKIRKEKEGLKRKM